jgi:hypothetical protein
MASTNLSAMRPNLSKSKETTLELVILSALPSLLVVIHEYLNFWKTWARMAWLLELNRDRKHTTRIINELSLLSKTPSRSV